MSADEESFIVLEETPSMLQFSLLDSLTLNSQGDTLESADTTKSSININGSVINGSVVNGSASTDHPSRSQEPSFQFGNQMKSTESDLSFASLNAESISSTMTQNEVKSRTPPKTTLAQSFLLGDINCDKMKVIFNIQFLSMFHEKELLDFSQIFNFFQFTIYHRVIFLV